MTILGSGGSARVGRLMLASKKSLGYALIAALVGVQIATIFFAIPPQALSQGVSGEAVHYHERIISQQSRSTNTMATVMTLSAAELAEAGFQPNDEVLILFFGVFGSSNTQAEAEWEITYGGAGNVVTNAAEPRLDFGGAGRERAASWMGRLDLGDTISDIDLDWLSSANNDDVYLEKAEFVVIRLADFGVEGIDWFWNKSTTTVQHTTTFSSTNRAAVTWTPSAVEDWIAFGYVQTAIDSTSVNSEARLMLDGALAAGDWSEAGESNAEELVRVFFDYAPSLSAAQHTYAIQTRDDGAGVNDHRESAVFVFHKAAWPDIYVTEPGTVSVANATDAQAASITDSLSKAQNALMFGLGTLNIDTVDRLTYMWIRDGASTIIEPVIDDGSGLNNQSSYDLTDELPVHIMAYRELSAGAQDLDLFVHHTGGATENLSNTKFIVLGLGLAVAEPEEEEAPPRTIILDAGIIQLISGKIIVLPNGEGGGAGPVYEE